MTWHAIRRLGSRQLALGSLVVAVAATPAVIWVTGQSGRAAAGSPVASAATIEDARRFDRDVRRSLSPMLMHVRALPTALARLAATPGGGADRDLGAQATRWADDSATARDLVGRLHPVDVPEAVEIQSLYVDGTMLYTEAARLAAQAALTPASRQDLARGGLRLLLLGDRAFDVGRRLLRRYSGAEPETWVLAAAVPDFAKEGLDPDQPGPPAAGRSGLEPTSTPTVPDDRWFSRSRSVLETARDVLDNHDGLYQGQGDPSGAAVADARQLEAASTRLAQPIPTSRQAAEGVVALRLALLTTGQSWRGHHNDPGVLSAARLRLIGERLWTAGANLLARSGIQVPAFPAATDAGIDPGILWAGGRFEGHPPALKPGGDPADGVPGGLPEPRLEGLGP